MQFTRSSLTAIDRILAKVTEMGENQIGPEDLHSLTCSTIEEVVESAEEQVLLILLIGESWNICRGMGLPYSNLGISIGLRAARPSVEKRLVPDPTQN